MIINETYKLNNGLEIPKLGLGTWFIKDKDAPEVVRKAVEVGYRHFDTARAYGNERGVAEGVKTSSLPREELFVTTKIVAEAKSYKKAVKEIEDSLERMGLDYIDLIIIHSPQPWLKWRRKKRFFEENLEVWKALEEAYKEGKVKAIGVSNFLEDDLQNILDHCEIKPMVNQILTHISNTPLELINYCQENDILVEAYSPIGHGELLKNEKVKQMAKKYNVSAPQLAIRYIMQLGLVALPKTQNPEYMKMNADIDFKISNEDMEILKNVEQIKNYGKYSFFPVYSGK